MGTICFAKVITSFKSFSIFAVQCAVPELPANIVRPLKGLFNVGESHVLKCSGGYVFAGNPILICTSQGTFTPVYGMCTPGYYIIISHFDIFTDKTIYILMKKINKIVQLL